jgi:thioredoxin 1
VLELTNDNFQKEVIESGRLVLVNFWRPGCGACYKMDPIIEEVEKEIGERAKIGKLNVFEAPEIAEKYGIPATPALIIFKNGEAVERAVGARSKQALIDKLNSL